MSSTQKDLTVIHVLEMFRGLNLPVTDDGRQIEAKEKELRGYHLRLSNSPDPQQSHRAKVWFKNLTSLKEEREELLSVVRDHFTQFADTALETALSSGTKTLTAEVHAQLERFALDQCRCDAPLARGFVNEYMQSKGLKVGEEFVFPRLVEQLSATSTVGQVELHWKLPTEKCDEVIVKRFGTTKTGKLSKIGRELCRGHLSSTIDREVEPGQRYRYEVYSTWRGVESQTGVAVEAVAIGEVLGVERRWVEDHVELRWQKPSEGCEVFVFRAPSPLTPVQRGVPDPLPDDPEARLVFRGTASEWQDRAVMTGKEYHYLLVGSFAPGHFSDGVSVSILTPTPPPAVTGARAEYVDGAVAVRWEPTPGERQVEYVVVRREGSAPSGKATDGQIIGMTGDTRYLDDEVITGRRYTYAVFTRVEDLYSLTGATTSPVDILAEVTELDVKTGDGTVELSWRTPANVSRVIVRRGVSPPRDHTDGEWVNLTGEGNAKDEGLENGQRYHYLACCAYRPTETDEVFSPGIRIDGVVPDRPPEMARDFAVRVESREVVCTWTPPGYGQVVVVRTAEPHELPLGQRLSADGVTRLGERIATERGRACDAQPDINTPYYSVFTVAGEHAIAGGTGCAVVCPDVTDLRLSATRDGVILRWAWPPGCTVVRVVRRLDAWPKGPDDVQATAVLCTRVEYMAAGEKYVDTIQRSEGEFRYVAYAQASGAPGQFFAPGTDPGCRAVIQWAPWMTLHYRLSSPNDKHPRKGKEIRLTWRVEEPLPNFAGFALIASETKPPLSLDDGLELFHWTPQKGQVVGEHEAWVSLAPVQRRRWARFFCKAIVTDPAQRPVTLVIHPNTCVPISAQGEVQVAKRDNDGPTYRFGVPRTVICPLCFEEFPVEQMLFTSFTGGETLNAQYTRLDRLLRRPLRPPKNTQGQLCTRKLCPDHLHVLPFTAGTQESLIIGIVGARFSGKSHYIAALVDRLAGQVAADFQAGLLPVTDETSDRYQREFYDPLFGKRLELPMTTGTPPPLIYDLYLSGRLWGEEQDRAVTLALYDTAGSNFDDPTRVRQMVQYLRVASGIIFLIDPLQSPAIRETLPASVPLPDADLMAEPYGVISRVLTELENRKIVTKSGPLSTPVAVVLTKCDVLRDAGLIEANRLWSDDRRHVGYFDTEIYDDITGMMGECVMHWNLKAYNTVTTRFSRHGFFGVSATGCASDKMTRRYKYISPWRVEDPLLWLLAELGVIPTR